MRKTFILYLIITTLLLSASAWAAEFNFRNNIKWGMTQNEVKILEKTPLVYECQQELIYRPERIMGGFSGFVRYFFIGKNSLCEANYLLLFSSQTNTNNSLQAQYNTVKQVLANQYGAPYKDGIDTEMKMKAFLKIYGDDLPAAVLNGAGTPFTIWRSEDTDIVLSMVNDNNEISFQIRYISHVYLKSLK